MALPVFYDPRQHTDANVSMSPSAGKPAQVMESWGRTGIPIEVMPVTPTTRENLRLAHEIAYVDAVLDLKQRNGFGNKLAEVAATLPWTTGSIVSAARHVARCGGVAISPTSGFHHACYRNGGGFCTFNGLMVAVRVLQFEELARRVGILDIDMHYGNGTDDIIRRLDVKDVVHWTFGSHVEGPGDAEQFLEELPGVLATFDECEVVLYQAGADPYVEDPLGGVLTMEQLRRRDRLVFQHFARTRVPLVWNLAGGYTRDEEGTIAPVLAIHDATLEECAAAYSVQRST
jgi:acetoin utilization deacetylase AcuC-like enzyme